MPRSADAAINGELLVWARESAGMDVEEAAQRLRVSEEKLSTWEKSSARPTVNQLRNAAKLYKQSFAAFYLPSPPAVFRPPVHDYRRLPDAVSHAVSSEMSLNVRMAMDRRLICLELFAEEHKTLKKFTPEATLIRNPMRLANTIRDFLGITLDQQRSWENGRKAFNNWRDAIERSGALVFQATKFPVEVMRGYSIAEFPLPIIVVNRKDTYNARIFTMLHELGHLVLRKSGVCDLEESPGRPPKEQKVEVFCNHLAGETLVPKDSLVAEPEVQSHRGMRCNTSDLVSLSRRYSVSREVILRRLLKLKLTDVAFYTKARRELQKQYESRSKKGGRIPPPTNAVSTMGKPFVRLVLEAFYSDRLTSSDASDYLGIRLKHLEKIGQAVGLE